MVCLISTGRDFSPSNTSNLASRSERLVALGSHARERAIKPAKPTGTEGTLHSYPPSSISRSPRRRRETLMGDLGSHQRINGPGRTKEPSQDKSLRGLEPSAPTRDPLPLNLLDLDVTLCPHGMMTQRRPLLVKLRWLPHLA